MSYGRRETASISFLILLPQISYQDLILYDPYPMDIFIADRKNRAAQRQQATCSQVDRTIRRE